MFTDEQRAIFSYHNGERDVKADPRVLHRQSTLHGAPKLHRDMLSANPATADAQALSLALQAEDALIGVLRGVFGMAPLDPETGSGATDLMCLAVWRDFNAFLSKKKMTPETLPTSPFISVSDPSLRNMG